MKKLLILILVSIYSLNGFSSEPSNSSDPYLGLASSVFLGFGTGPAIQNQEPSHMWAYASTQGLGLILLLAGAGSCHDDCSSSNKTLRTVGGSLFLTSRLIEIGDSSLFAWKYYESTKMKSVVLFVPANNGGSLATVISF